MKKLRLMFLAASLAGFTISVETAFSETKTASPSKATPSQLLIPPSKLKARTAEADQTRPAYLYLVCDGAQAGWHGSFDLAEGGVFAYCLGANGYRENVTYLGESGGYYFFQEQDYPSWYWAFSTEPDGSGKFTVYGTFGSDQFNLYGLGDRCPIEP